MRAVEVKLVPQTLALGVCKKSSEEQAQDNDTPHSAQKRRPQQEWA
jgi:hypothetical protein